MTTTKVNCISGHHEPPVPATVHGSFRNRYNPINNSDDVWYCTHCAEVGEMLDMFAPEEKPCGCGDQECTKTLGEGDW